MFASARLDFHHFGAKVLTRMRCLVRSLEEARFTEREQTTMGGYRKVFRTIDVGRRMKWIPCELGV